MIKKLNNTGNMYYLYMTKTILQLMMANPLTSKFLIKIKNKTMYINKLKENVHEEEYLCIREIKKTGSGFGLYFTQTLLELIDVNPGLDNVEISIEDETLIIKKADV